MWNITLAVCQIAESCVFYTLRLEYYSSKCIAFYTLFVKVVIVECFWHACDMICEVYLTNLLVLLIRSSIYYPGSPLK